MNMQWIHRLLELLSQEEYISGIITGLITAFLWSLLSNLVRLLRASISAKNTASYISGYWITYFCPVEIPGKENFELYHFFKPKLLGDGKVKFDFSYQHFSNRKHQTSPRKGSGYAVTSAGQIAGTYYTEEDLAVGTFLLYTDLSPERYRPLIRGDCFELSNGRPAYGVGNSGFILHKVNPPILTKIKMSVGLKSFEDFLETKKFYDLNIK